MHPTATTSVIPPFYPVTNALRARELTDRIKVALGDVWHLIEEAYTIRAWADLGYASWDEYCTREFDVHRLRVPREERRTVVASMRESGMSIRAIAAAIGIDAKTVRRVLEALEPADNTTIGIDGKTYRWSAPVTGVNGKTYQRAAKRPTVRKKPNHLGTAIGDLTRAAKRVTRLAENNSIPEYAAKNRAALCRNRDLLEQALEALEAK